MLTLVSFQLVSFVESLCTVQMVTLKGNKKQTSGTTNKQFYITVLNSRSFYFISLLLLMVNSSHVVLHAGICDKGLGASVNQTPGDEASVRGSG